MGHYTRTGKQVIFNENGVSTHIADGGDEEKADAIVQALNGKSSSFIPKALVTCSPLFHGDMVGDNRFRRTVNDCIDALNQLDKIKKSLFYGRDNNLIADGENDVSDLPTLIGSDTAIAIDIVHAILGKATEAGELLEALRSYYNGDPIDWVNIKEEMGDGFWYDALLAHRGDFTFEEAQSVIIEKLAARFPDKFAAYNANNRDLDAERAILEGSSVPLADDEVRASTVFPDGSAIEHTRKGEVVIQPTPPVGGAENVNAIEKSADAAFDAVDNVGSDSVPAPATTGTNNSELSKSPAERTKRFPDEHLSNQPVRREDLE